MKRKEKHRVRVFTQPLPARTVKPRPNDRNMPTQHVATLLGATCCVRLATLLRCVGRCWLKFDHGQIWANNTQHVATHRNTVAKRTQHVAPNIVAICCVGMLRSFGRGLKETTLLLSSLGNKEVWSHTFFTFLWCRLLEDSLKEHIDPSFRAQSDKLQHETRRAHQVKKKTFTFKLRKPLNHKQRVLALHCAILKASLKWECY